MPTDLSSRLASGPVRVSTRRVSHADEHGANFSGWRHEFIQMEPGRFEGLARELRFGGLQVFHDRVSRRVRYRGGAWERSRVFISFLPNCGPVHYGNRGIPPQTVLSHRWDEARRINLTSAFETVGMCVDEMLIDELMGLHGQSSEGRRQRTRQLYVLREGAGQRIQLKLLQLLDQIGRRSEVAENPLCRSLIIEDLLQSVASLMRPHPQNYDKPKASVRAYIAYTAQQYIEENLATGLSMYELCSLLNVSRRAVEYAFQDIIGTSPKRYILAMRLARVRREILSGDPKASVSEIGERWGFFHLGRFGAAYKDFFGELPSKSVIRARA
jgi:AraC family ethanolamine operon transcriptional activator